MKRLLLYVHFNKFNQLSDHVVYQLQQMRGLFERVVFISNSPFEATDQERLEKQGLIDDFIQRKNTGFDFAAWRDGMVFVGFDVLEAYDNVTLMNDTCFGPLYDMAPIYEGYEAEGVDFWGITNHRAYQESKGHSFAEHIQSYYKVFSQKMLQSQVFKDFWQGVEDFSDVQEVIDHYEIRSTSVFMDAGFSYQTILDTRELDDSNILHPDFSYYAPDVILQRKVPFIKVKAFQALENRSVARYMLDYVDEHSDYPVDLIVKHMAKITFPDEPYLLTRKYLPEVQDTTAINKKIAVHLHVFYPELLADFLEAFGEFSFAYDLFLTTNTDEKEAMIKKELEERAVKAEVIRTENFGRDVMPFLALRDQLRQYDIVGHFHTKRSLEAAFFAGESWRTELMDMLLKPADNIMRNFEARPDLGIVIADMPSFFRLNKIVDPDNENKKIAPYLNNLWERMGLGDIRKVNFHDFSTYTMSYGTFFWAKTEVIEPLFAVEIKPSEIPPEPLPQNTMLHAIERILVYMAWGKDMDFAISKNPVEMTPFVDQKTFNLRWSISPQNANDVPLRVLTKLFVKRTVRFIKYRIKKLIGKA
ncbi:rhamnan synthesis F family protein [Lactococcus termiticola]|uniref:Alpha-L-Rha alpha-1,3-L-rhamnosyltransferase n=1 Tax=Lactococcus termiticola TaxID=2169526 RepID=A0A2R5HJP8_9LACT|nr:rhamnan synthesis F family protein [Lactococcus termiticola]GBG96551.1 alpha-L-Rha alpha-1,3-L-rhamnosyltransferase [Lactococcus termiticola]